MHLSFSHNWNGKLFLDCFGTVRLHCPEKYFVGNELDIQYKNQNIGIAKVVAVRKFHFEHINDVLSYLDVGKPAQYLASLQRKFYERSVEITPTMLLDHIVLQYIKRDMDLQTELIKFWWQDKLEQDAPQNQNLLFT